jgi:hypothetical protein
MCGLVACKKSCVFECCLRSVEELGVLIVSGVVDWVGFRICKNFVMFCVIVLLFCG